MYASFFFWLVAERKYESNIKIILEWEMRSQTSTVDDLLPVSESVDSMSSKTMGCFGTRASYRLKGLSSRSDGSCSHSPGL